MIVNCEECGKRYKIDPDKIPGDRAKFKCKECGHIITVRRHAEPAGTPAEAAPQPPPEEPAAQGPNAEPGPSEEKAPGEGPAAEKPETKLSARDGRRRRLGLRGKMTLLFFAVPILCVAAAGWLYIHQLDKLSYMITRESTETVNRMAEDQVAQIARSVAAQCRIYLKANPGVQGSELANDPEFQEIAVQKVGETGYTAFHEQPGADGIWRNWAHPNPDIVGIDMKSLKKPMGASFPGFWRVFTGGRDGKESRGYYTWQDRDGGFRDKFMVCTPVEGTPYVVAATTYLEEFTAPVKRLADEAEALTLSTKTAILGILAGTLILIGLLVSIYGHRLTRRITYLTDAAEKISVGELDEEIEIRSNDEIGDLAEAISRMQDSIRLSIERLRRRRRT
jgi:predicted Zn finger-like uncharacterized protein